MTRLLVLVAAALAVAVPTGGAAARQCWLAPVDARVVDPFREPDCRWCPGNRGIEYGTARGDTVRAVATGEVTYAGAIDGVSYLVVRHADGRRATYGNLVEVGRRRGDVVIAGTPVGLAAGRVHFGLRDGDRYIDPAPFMGTFVHRARLVPLDGSAAAPAPPPTLRCETERPLPGLVDEKRPLRW